MDFFIFKDGKPYGIPKLADLQGVIRVGDKSYRGRNFIKNRPMSFDEVQEQTDVVATNFSGNCQPLVRFECTSKQAPGREFCIKLHRDDFLGLNDSAIKQYLVSRLIVPEDWKKVTCDWYIAGYEAPNHVLFAGTLRTR